MDSALLIVDKQGRGAARLAQLSVNPAGAKGLRAAGSSSSGGSGGGSSDSSDSGGSNSGGDLGSSDTSSEDFEWEFRLLDAADLLAEQKGHLWCCVSAAEGTKWRAALLARGYKPRLLPEDEPLAKGEWLIKATPLRERV